MRSPNPYAPRQGRPRPAEPVLPVARLRRLGAPLPVFVALADTWPRLDEGGRKRLLADFASRSDPELAAWLVALEPPYGSAVSVGDWAESHATPGLAARSALAAEMARDRPRATLIERLERVTAAGEDW